MVERLLYHSLLPSVAVLPSCTAWSVEVWKVLEQLPSASRFRVYGETLEGEYRRSPVLQFISGSTCAEVTLFSPSPRCGMFLFSCGGNRTKGKKSK